MDNFNPANNEQTGYQSPETVHRLGPNPGQTQSAAVTNGATKKGRGRFLGFMAAAVLAAGTGVIGYAAADTMIGNGEVESASVTPGDESGQPVSEPGEEPIPADTNDDGSEDIQADPEGETPVPGTAMTVEEANQSVVRIEATGEFADLEFGFIEGVGSGSGFIINDEGIAVTNNHVVAGAAFLEVFVPGEDQPRNARILATSECSDLAVIDIDGSGFPAVALNMTSPAIGTDVYAAGYPLGDPEFTLTKGIVSKAETRGDTHLSSVDGVLEHDARINPGNSGGPLFDVNGQVVGVNYQGNPSTDQSFAITAADALPIIDQLSAGVSVDSIGINGQIVDLGDRFGLFLSSVETGSMADNVGLVPGDVILELENVAVSTDGTMGDYCDVLRTNGTDVPLDITVLRPSVNQVLFGTLNGEGLNVGFDGGEMMEQAGMDAPVEPAAAEDYVLVTDDSGTVSLEVPVLWSEVATNAIESTTELPNVTASEDLESYRNDWVVGGVQLTAFDPERYNFDSIWNLRNDLLENCDTVEMEQDADFGEYTGVLRIGHDCGPDATASLVLFQVESPNSVNFASGIIQVIDAQDVEAAERALATFTVR